jgi:hypothetical protein
METIPGKNMPLPARIGKMVLFDVFLSHDWGGGNHDRVSAINDALKRRGVKTWFDGEQMAGDILLAMADGIENSRIMIPFLTENYRNKVNSNDERDNCQKELRHGEQQLGAQNMLAVVMETSMRNPRDWKGRLGMVLGHRLYVADFSGCKQMSGLQFEEEMDKLYASILLLRKNQCC